VKGSQVIELTPVVYRPKDVEQNAPPLQGFRGGGGIKNKGIFFSVHVKRTENDIIIIKCQHMHVNPKLINMKLKTNNCNTFTQNNIY
jgi:hypothetical protein